MSEKDDVQGPDDTQMGLIRMNDLLFDEDEEYSVTSHVRMREFQFLGNSVSSPNPVPIDIPMGADLLNGRKSFISFRLSFASANAETQFHFPIGMGAMSLFSQIRIVSRAGVEISRYLYAPQIARHEMMNCVPLGTADMNGMSYFGDGASTRANLSNTSYDICIPLACLHGFFNTKNLIPTNAMGMLRLELTLNTVRGAMRISGGAEPTSFSLSNISVWGQAHTLTDSALMTLNFIAAQRGLNFYFTDILANMTNGTASTVPVTTAASRSRCLMAWVHVQATRADAADDDMTRTVDPTDDTKVFWNLGGLYFPTRTIERLVNLWTHNIIAENAYVNGMHERPTEIVFKQSQARVNRGLPGFRIVAAGTTNLSAVINTASAVVGHTLNFDVDAITSEFYYDRSWATGGYGTHAVSLERSEILEANGLSIGASRPLNLTITPTGNANTPFTVYVFVKHHKLLTCTSDGNMVVSE